MKRNGVDEALMISLFGSSPRVSPDAWLAPGVVLSGNVVVADGANLWFGVVARGDLESIEIGPRVNIQDGCVLHTDPGHPLRLEADVAIGHGAIVHGCTVEEGALIGMGAIVLTGARIGRDAVVAAGAVVLEDAEVPPASLAVGIPARVVGPARPGYGAQVARSYLERADRYRAALAERRADHLPRQPSLGP